MRGLLAAWLAALMLLPASVAGTGTVTVSPITETKSWGQGRFTGTYPRITGIGDAEAQSRLNALFSLWERDALTETKALSRTADDRSAPVEGSLDFATTRNRDGLVSLVTTLDIRRGNTPEKRRQRSLTFRAADGQECTLTDLFIPHINVADCIRRIAMEERPGAETAGLCDRISDKERCQMFYLTDTELVLWWEEDDLTVTSLHLPLSSLKVYLAFSPG